MVGGLRNWGKLYNQNIIQFSKRQAQSERESTLVPLQMLSLPSEGINQQSLAERWKFPYVSPTTVDNEWLESKHYSEKTLAPSQTSTWESIYH